MNKTLLVFICSIIFLGCDPEYCSSVRLINDSSSDLELEIYTTEQGILKTEVGTLDAGEKYILDELCGMGWGATYPDQLGIDSIRIISDNLMDKTFSDQEDGINPMKRDNWIVTKNKKRFGGNLYVDFTITDEIIQGWQ